MTERFDRAAENWDKGDMRRFIAESVFQTIASRIALLGHMDILDFGCGTGLLGFRIAPQVRSVTGVDLSEKMLEQAAAKNTPQLRMVTVCADLLNEPLDRTFEGIVSSMAMHHVEDTAALFRAFRKHIKRDGFVAIADLDAEDGTFHSHGNEGVFHLGFDREKLRETAEEAGFSNVRFHTACTIEKEGKNYPVFLMTATKL